MYDRMCAEKSANVTRGNFFSLLDRLALLYRKEYVTPGCCFTVYAALTGARTCLRSVDFCIHRGERDPWGEPTERA